MDPVKTGRFLAELRRKNDLTQEALGEKLGVTSKTISRWENGNYMPGIGMLQLLSRELHVSINEILSGEMLDDAAFRAKTDENIISVGEESLFTLREKSEFYTAKWYREHRFLYCMLAFVPICCVAVPILIGKPWLAGIAPAVAVIGYGLLNNRRMIYVEKHLYDR